MQTGQTLQDGGSMRLVFSFSYLDRSRTFVFVCLADFSTNKSYSRRRLLFQPYKKKLTRSRSLKRILGIQDGEGGTELPETFSQVLDVLVTLNFQPIHTSKTLTINVLSQRNAKVERTAPPKPRDLHRRMMIKRKP